MKQLRRGLGKKGLGCFALLVLSTDCFAQKVESSVDFTHQIEQIRLWHSPDRTRVVFDVSENVKHTMFMLENPLRLVVDIENANLSRSLPVVQSNPHVGILRSGVPAKDKLRFVFELKKPLLARDFLLSPNELYGHRLVVDLEDRSYSNASQTAATSMQQSPPIVANDTVSLGVEQKPFLIAVNAGHGGEDPGAIGYRGSFEKDLTLKIAQRLVATINADPTMKAFLVREGDYYIKLHRRRELAKERNADMYISIHADAFTKSSASGFSVFALSQSGATSAMARALAAKENASDLIGGVSLADKDEVLAKVLVDLSMTNTISESVNFGGRVLKELGKLGKLHSKRVEQAGFAELKSADIPSVLIETGFITNPQEEKNLRTSQYQRRVAQGIYAAIASYRDQAPFKTNASYAAATRVDAAETVFESLVKPKKPIYHKVVRGDSLSEIADRYRTSVSTLKRINNLRGDTVVLGQRIKLPGNSNASRQTSSKNTKSGASNNRPSYHTVKRGESLSVVSARYNVSISSLKRLNNLSNNTVYVGQRLKLSGSANTNVASAARYHVVKRGDTLSEIAEKYGSSMRQIMRVNSLRSRTIRLGQRLKIP